MTVAIPATLVAAALAWPAAPGAGCTVPDSAVPTVVVGTACVAPSELTVAAGGSVVWRNRSDAGHDVRGASLSFRLPARSSYGTAFAQEGTYAYACVIHPAVRGVVQVTAAEPVRSRPDFGGAWLAAALAAVIVPATVVAQSLRR